MEYAPGAKTVKACPSMRNADKLNNELTGSGLDERARMRIAQSVCQLAGFRLSRFLPRAESGIDMPASGTPLRNAPPKHENQDGGNHDRRGESAPRGPSLPAEWPRAA